MGRRLIALGSTDPDLRVAGGICSPDSPHLLQDLGLLAGIAPLGILCQEKFDDLSTASVMLDFSHPTLLPKVLEFTEKTRIPLVIGTTGLSKENFTQIKELSQEVPIFYAANYSLGVAVLIDAVRRISSALPEDFLISIEETHHIHKKDAPSGTALAIAAVLPKDIPIESYREAEVIGEHAVIFQSPQEKILLSHSALSRDLFAQGALRATKFIVHQSAGLFSMADLIAKETYEAR